MSVHGKVGSWNSRVLVEDFSTVRETAKLVSVDASPFPVRAPRTEHIIMFVSEKSSLPKWQELPGHRLLASKLGNGLRTFLFWFAFVTAAPMRTAMHGQGPQGGSMPAICGEGALPPSATRYFAGGGYQAIRGQLFVPHAARPHGCWHARATSPHHSYPCPAPQFRCCRLSTPPPKPPKVPILP